MVRDFSFFVWGLILVFVDIHLNGFDVAPDFIGYALVAIGSSSLIQYAPSFQMTRNLAWPLVALSLLLYVTPPNMVQVLHLLTTVLTILLIWSLLGGVIRFTTDRERPDLAGHAVIYRRTYVGIAIVAFLFQQAAYAQPDSAAFFVTLAMVATLVILFFILRLLHVVKHELAVDSSVA